MACEPIPTRTMNTQWQVGGITDEPTIKSQKIAAICLPTSDILQPMRGNQQSIKRTGSIREENDDPLSFHWRLHRHQIELTQPQKRRGQSTGCLCLIFQASYPSMKQIISELFSGLVAVSFPISFHRMEPIAEIAQRSCQHFSSNNTNIIIAY